jgi:hypothetical protein
VRQSILGVCEESIEVGFEFKDDMRIDLWNWQSLEVVVYRFAVGCAIRMLIACILVLLRAYICVWSNHRASNLGKYFFAMIRFS